MKKRIAAAGVIGVLLLMAMRVNGQPGDYIPAITSIDLSSVKGLGVLAEPLPMEATPGQPVADPVQRFLTKLKMIEDKRFQYNQLVRQNESVLFLKQSLISIRQTRDRMQEVYDLQERIRHDLKKVKALKDFGIADMVYMSEKILGESLNPADYMIETNSEAFENIKRKFSYRASTKVSSDARDVYRFLTQYRESDSIKGYTEVERFNEIAHVLGYGSGWRNYVAEQQLRSAMAQNRLYDVMEDKVKRNWSLILTSDTMSMSDGERLQADREMVSMLAEIERGRLETAKTIEEVAMKEQQRMFMYLDLAARERIMQSTFAKVVSFGKYKKNKGFRMVDHKVTMRGKARKIDFY